MELNVNTVAICGLFCGTCPSYPHECEGCLSDGVLMEDCKSCSNGFRDCANIHNVTRCYECIDFPCEKLDSFKDKHYQNGIGHHKHVIENLDFMKENGIQKWLEKQILENTCSKCGQIIYWYDKNTHKC